jgi:chromosome segregation ATPase
MLDPPTPLSTPTLTSNTRQLAKAAALELLQNGQRPTAERVRQAIGQGAQQTILSALDELWAEVGERLREPRLPEALVEPVAELWARALAEADQQWQEERGRLGGQLEIAERQLEALTEQNRALETALAAAEARATAAEQRGEEQAARIEALETKRLELDGALTRLRDENDQLRASVQAERDGRERDQAAWLQQIDKARQDLKTANADRERSNQLLDQERETAASQRVLLAQREQRLEDLQAKLTAADDTMAQLEQRTEVLGKAVQEAEIATLRTNLARDQLAGALQSAQEATVNLQQRLDASDRSRADLAAENARLREQLVGLHASQDRLEETLALALGRRGGDEREADSG